VIAQEKKPKRWFAINQAELAVFFRVSIDTIATWRKKGMPGTPGRYDLSEALEWWRTEGPGRPRGGNEFGSGAIDDLIVAAGDSPNLERYRLAKAQLAELELETKRRSVFPRDMARNALGRVASLWRRYGERLGKRHGPEEVVSFNETFEEAQRVILDEFCDGDGLSENSS
jgi:phage terminase Nu1 subunit (DNA packaging protein)